MAEILARVIGPVAKQRGPDVLHRIRIPETWLKGGEIIEVDLPRNLTCAACEGGGCDVCGRAGATSLRGRDAPPESIEITLPAEGEVARTSQVVLRIPRRGGMSPDPEIRERGLLLLRIEVASEPDISVRLVKAPGVSALEGAPDSGISLAVRLALLLGLVALVWLATMIGLWFVD